MADDNKTPGRLAMALIQDNNTISPFKTPGRRPVAKRKLKEKILDEDNYVEQIGKIIQRDYFPDLERLKAQNDYLEAIERNDVTRMRELFMKYNTGGTNRPPTERLSSPATFETPANIHHQSSSQLAEDGELLKVVGDATPTPSLALSSTKSSSSTVPPLSLDQFLNAHTSQDNHSFNEILIESEQKLRDKYSYLYSEENHSEFDKIKQLALPTIEQQCALPEKPLNVDTWNYKNRNYIMYTPDGVPLTDAQLIEMSKRRQEVIHANTRLEMNPFNEHHSKETINELAKTQAKVLDGKIGVDGKELLQTDPRGIRHGFGFVRTPSPSPSMISTPLMTWGEIEGTPFRLDGSDTPLMVRKSQVSGPAFKMAAPPKREQLAFALAEMVGEKNRSQKRNAINAARKQLISTPSPRPHSSVVDRLATMSPAARKLATGKLGFDFDYYSPGGGASSPWGRRVKTPQTPQRSSSKQNQQRGITPKLNLGIRRAGYDDNLTDDLLKIDLPKRQKAADFF